MLKEAGRWRVVDLRMLSSLRSRRLICGNRQNLLQTPGTGLRHPSSSEEDAGKRKMPEGGTRRKEKDAGMRYASERGIRRKLKDAGKREVPENDARSVRLVDGRWYRPETSVDVYGLVPAPTGMQDRSQTPSTGFRHPFSNHCHN